MTEPTPPRKPAITYPYKGVRRSWYVYHPAMHGPSDRDGQWEACSNRFHRLLNDFVEVAELYTDQQTHHDVVGGDRWKKEVIRLFNSIEREGKDTYQLESLAEVIFDRDTKIEQRNLPYQREIKDGASRLRGEDFNLTLTGGGLVDPRGIINRGWAS